MGAGDGGGVRLPPDGAEGDDVHAADGRFKQDLRRVRGSGAERLEDIGEVAVRAVLEERDDVALERPAARPGEVVAADGAQGLERLGRILLEEIGEGEFAAAAERVRLGEHVVAREGAAARGVLLGEVGGFGEGVGEVAPPGLDPVAQAAEGERLGGADARAVALVRQAGLLDRVHHVVGAVLPAEDVGQQQPGAAFGVAVGRLQREDAREVVAGDLLGPGEVPLAGEEAGQGLRVAFLVQRRIVVGREDRAAEFGGLLRAGAAVVALEHGPAGQQAPGEDLSVDFGLERGVGGVGLRLAHLLELGDALREGFLGLVERVGRVVDRLLHLGEGGGGAGFGRCRWRGDGRDNAECRMQNAE